MPVVQVDSIFVRKVTPGDFVNVERLPGAGPQGGGGQLYFDVPLSPNRLSVDRLWAFLDAVPGDPQDSNTWPEAEIVARSIGHDEEPTLIQFLPRRGGNTRYRIANQNRQAAGGNRHPAWTAARGFPIAPDDVEDPEDPRLPDLTHLKLFIVKTVDGEFFASYTNGLQIPHNWPGGHHLEELFNPNVSSRTLEYQIPRIPNAPELVNEILEAWRESRNVLLYGPPGTGKTFAMQFIWDLLGRDAPLQALYLDSENPVDPFQVRGIELPFERPFRREWTTFHQNYSYENFVLSHRPEQLAGGGFALQPRLGLLLDTAVSVDPNIVQEIELRANSGVVFVDEVNRGNVSRIFGEFITFMDSDYRAGPNGRPIPVPLPGVRADNFHETEEISRQRGGPVRLPSPWYFPSQIYILCSMNSVDHAVAPLDAALARRFARIEVQPNLDLLAEWLGIENPAELLRAGPFAPVDRDGGDAEGAPLPGEENDLVGHEQRPRGERSPAETAFLLLHRLNFELASILGPDFEIGHTYLRPVADAAGEGDESAFRALARVWDQALYPQLRERLANRPAELMRVLRLDRSGRGPARYLIQARTPAAGAPNLPAGARPPLDVPSFESAAHVQHENVVFSLRYLAGAVGEPRA